MIIAAATVEPARRTGDRLGATLAGLALAAVLHAVALFYIGHGFVDDSFIFFRYAENLASGHGFSWNVGEPPVEGHSSFLWLFPVSGNLSSDRNRTVNAGILAGDRG
jgi:hypothetical protein